MYLAQRHINATIGTDGCVEIVVDGLARRGSRASRTGLVSSTWGLETDVGLNGEGREAGQRNSEDEGLHGYVGRKLEGKGG